GLNACGGSPRRLSRSSFPDGKVPQLGWDPVTVPGAVSAWSHLSRRFGRLPFSSLMEPAIAYAREGFPVSPQAAGGWARAAVRYRDFPEWQRVFAPEGRTPHAGDCFTNPDQAGTIERIAASNGNDFYHGELARRMAEISARDGGYLDFQDLDEHQPLETTPLSVSIGDAEVHELPPNGQGLAALVAMGILDRLDLNKAEPDHPLTLHLQMEAMKIGFQDAFRIISDPDLLTEDPQSVLTAEALEQRAARISRTDVIQTVFPWPQWNSTVYLATADEEGNAVSFIQSNFEGFGSGVVIDGTGIAMQNRGSGFHPDPDHPGTIAGGVRPFHTIIPGFVTRDGTAEMPFGIMGGPMQAQGHLQFISRCLLSGQNPQEAMDAPRWRLFEGKRVEVEPGTDPATIEGLSDLGHDVIMADSRTVRFGGGQAIQRLHGAWIGASDSRRDGQAVGF
ncbi:MAG: gamma-glutamyltransferase family protein, partial [Phycisphaerales bacterium]|nr:gamma-glutamyltransferase family protein [Phycisphaerales bacterium]